MAEGMCRYESLKDGSLGLEDIALMNDFLMMRADNQDKADRIAKQKQER